MSRCGGALVLAIALAVPVTASVVGCRHRTESATTDEAGSSAPFVVRSETEGLLLTWIDEKGDFHVEQKPADVPLVGRDAVRVVDPSREEGTHGDKVFVADLRVANSDGAYPMHSMTREEFDALAVTRRAKNAPTLAGGETRDAGSRGGSAPPSDTVVAGRPAVIVYGASWCGACHQAEAYFRKKGITYIEKDIEQDSAAATEMNGKLRRAGLRGGSIPVLDVRGRILVGFDPRSVDEALGSPI